MTASKQLYRRGDRFFLAMDELVISRARRDGYTTRGYGRVIRGDKSVRLSSLQYRMLNALMLRAPCVVEYTDLYLACYGYTPPPEHLMLDMDTLKVHICHLRKRIAPLNLQLRTRHSMGMELVV